MLLLIGMSFLTLSGASTVSRHPHYVEGHDVMVHLFEWKWVDIAKDCELFLGPRGYGGVQISPPNENLVIVDRPWWERYQPVSYRLITRSGDEEAFKDMVDRCNKVGVRIYADAVFNHMSASAPVDAHGVGGSAAYYEGRLWPAVSYSAENFNSPVCDIEDYKKARQVRNCQLLGCADLNQTLEDTRSKIVNYLNNLIHLGVAGFRIDAAKHMWPEDLETIYSRLDDLNTYHGFERKTRPFIFQEVIDYGGGAVSAGEYTHMGLVTEYNHGFKLSSIFSGRSDLHWLRNWGEDWNLLPSNDALVFIDNHVTQRTNSIVSYKTRKIYKMAVAFMLAHTYGTPRIMSSYGFAEWDDGPVSDGEENLISPTFNPNESCGNGFICEHRWRQIYNMVAFRNAVAGTEVNDWWDNESNQIAFCRGNLGFIAFNQEGTDFRENLQTCLRDGVYCDVISGSLVNGRCTGKTVTVSLDGTADIEILADADDGVLAIHHNSRI